jgi:hypothetical protein
MDMKNIVAAFFIIVIILTLVDVQPYKAGYFLAPSTQKIEASVVVIVISIVVILAMILPRKGYLY